MVQTGSLLIPTRYPTQDRETTDPGDKERAPRNGLGALSGLMAGILPLGLCRKGLYGPGIANLDRIEELEVLHPAAEVAGSQ